ncbi:MAG: TIGR02450 family Trp-rich protein [Planctomycetota bacterium]
MHPHHPKRLVSSKWTATAPQRGERHWVVTGFRPSEGVVSLRAVLTQREELLPWRELRDRSVWRPGWER